MSFINLKIKADDKKILDKLATKWDRPLWKLFHQMVTYFDKTGYDPSQQEEKEVRKELDKFRSTIISFIRKQEKDIIIPLAGKIDSILAISTAALEQQKNASYGLIDDTPTESQEPKTDKIEDFTSEFLNEELNKAQIAPEKAVKEVKRYRKLLDKLSEKGKFKGNSFVLYGMNEELGQFFENKDALRS